MNTEYRTELAKAIVQDGKLGSLYERLREGAGTDPSGSGNAAGNAGSTVEKNQSLELPKGLNEKTLQMVRSRMKENAGKKMTSEEIALMVGLSRITVRRYLGYLQDCGELTSEIDYRTGGRPGILYRCM